MTPKRNRVLALATAGMLTLGTAAACDRGGAAGASGAPPARVGVILPDTTSAPRWDTDDPTYLKETFDAAGVPVEIRNARTDGDNFVAIGRQLLDGGAKVLIITSPDRVSGKAVIDEAHARGVPVIDYDRLTLGGGADYLVGYDAEAAGKLLAYGLRACLAERGVRDPVVAYLNGPRDDHNAVLAQRGYDSVLQPLYENGTAFMGPEQSVPGWSRETATDVFARMFAQQPRISAVVAADDDLAGAAIEVLRTRKRDRKVPVTGQDASVAGLRALLAGDQCVTVRKPVKPEAQNAAGLAIALFKGDTPAVPDELFDPRGGVHVPYRRLEPVAVRTPGDINTLIADGLVTHKELCSGRYAPLCAAAKVN